MVHFSECSTIAANCDTDTQIEMRDGIVEHVTRPQVAENMENEQTERQI